MNKLCFIVPRLSSNQTIRFELLIQIQIQISNLHRMIMIKK